MDEMYLVWSNEHRTWWRPNRSGYTHRVSDAGRYSREEAIKICRTRDQEPGQPLPELPIRESDVLRCLWVPPADEPSEVTVRRMRDEDWPERQVP